MSSSLKKKRTWITVGLEPYIGVKYAAWICAILRVKYMDDLGKVTESQIASIPGFGPKRVERIKEAMTVEGLSFIPKEKVLNREMVERAMADLMAEVTTPGRQLSDELLYQGRVQKGDQLNHPKTLH